MMPLMSFVASTLIGITFAAPIEYYATKYDHIDVEMILNNRRMVVYYAACMLGKGPCPPEGLEFKRIFPEALQTNCLRCTEKQKTVILHSVRRLKKEYPKVWAQMQEQWDPKEIYVKKFEETFSRKYSNPLSLYGYQTSNSLEDTKGSAITAVPSQLMPKLTTGANSVPETPKIVLNLSSSTTAPSPIINKSTIKNTIFTTTSKIISTKPSTITTTNKSITTPLRLPPLSSLPPVTNIGAGIEATVSLGNNALGEFVKGIGVLGNRLIETSADIADVVIKNLSRPL